MIQLQEALPNSQLNAGTNNQQCSKVRGSVCSSIALLHTKLRSFSCLSYLMSSRGRSGAVPRHVSSGSLGTTQHVDEPVVVIIVVHFVFFGLCEHYHDPFNSKDNNSKSSHQDLETHSCPLRCSDRSCPMYNPMCIYPIDVNKIYVCIYN